MRAEMIFSLVGGMMAVFSLGVMPLKWSKSTPLPEPRAGCAVGIVDGKFIISGGTYWEGSKGNWIKKVFTASTHAFDPATQEWEKLPDCPIPLGYAAHTVINNKLFVLGGYTGKSSNRKIFTLEKRQNQYLWQFYGELPENRLFAVALGVGSELFLLGGTTEFEPYDPIGTCCTTKTATNTLWVKDTTQPQNAWRVLTPQPGAVRWMFTAETDGESIFMFGGSFQIHKDIDFEYFNEVLRYRIAESRWEKAGSLPTSSSEATPFVSLYVDGRIVLISRAKHVWQLDLTTLKYSELEPLPEAAFVDKFVSFDHMIIGAGGENAIEGPRRRSEWTFLGRFASK